MKIVLWRAAKLLSYIEDARCLKVNSKSRTAVQPVQNALTLQWAFVDGNDFTSIIS